MGEEVTRASPPPSPPPPSPDRRVHSDPHGDGWRPAAGDSSLTAIEFRARRGERLGVENRTAIGRLSTSMDALGTTITGWMEASARRWASAASLLKWAGGIVGGLALVGAALWIWRFFSTLHH